MIHLVVLTLAFACFAIACYMAVSPHWNRLVAAGLALMLLAELIGAR